MRPPTSCSSSVPIRTTNKSRVPRPTSPSFTREATISASHENPTCNPAVNLIDGDQTAHNLPGDHAACTTGDHAAYPVAGDHAAHTAGDQAAHRTDPNRAERPIGDQAEQPTGDHAGCPSARHSSGITESPVPEHNLPNIPEKPYVNLIPLPCSPAVTNYCHAHGLAATVFTAQSTQPCVNAADSDTLPNPTDNILSHGGLADLASPISPDADNKHDILTQGISQLSTNNTWCSDVRH